MDKEHDTNLDTYIGRNPYGFLERQMEKNALVDCQNDRYILLYIDKQTNTRIN